MSSPEGSNYLAAGVNQIGVRVRSPLSTGLKRLHPDTTAASPVTKLARHGSTGGGSGDEPATSISSNRDRLLHLVSSDVQRLYSRHRQHLAELFFLQNNGGYLDFDTWLHSSPPQLTAYLQANSFNVNEVTSGRGPTATSQPTPVLPPVATPERTVSTATKAGTSTPTPSSVREIGDSVVLGEDSKRSPVIAGASTQGVSTVPAPTNLMVESSSVPVVPSSSVLPALPSTSAPTPVSASSTSGSSTPQALPPLDRQAVQGRLVLKLTQTKSPVAQVPSHRGPGRPAGRRSGSGTVNGTRYRSSIPSGRIEHAAKQEAVVLRRIAELRREGLWSADRLPKCADPVRSKTHWDYLLEEMKWLATDFEQERKWKKLAARKLATMAVRQRKEEEEKQKRAEVEKEKELKRIASFAAKEIRQFWNTIEKVVEYKTESILEAKRRRALDKHLDFIVGQTEKFSSLVQEGLFRPSTSSTATATAAKPEPVEGGDSEFELEESSEDDESTLDKEEEQVEKADVDEEVAMLQQECELDLDDILSSLPAGYLDMRDDQDAGDSTPTVAAPDEEVESVSSEESDHENAEEAASSSQTPTLPENVDFTKLRSEDSDVRQQELNHFAENAEKLQPKGYTLETTTVVTKVPFLLKHKLREYQHVGLDWLVTLYDRKLNGILADEMGLGKTIQTIALLAHLACEKGNWGPHLIVVPTTVMLNWEMECKKWCPGFKILTYYGSVKERKEKRHGWSKPNAFHVCVTSYKLVLQDHLVFRRKKWEYLILDEAQNIKNFKSQRWQMLLNFNAQRRLLLTGTPLQNSLMELWSLMHFLMPDIFSSHRDFKDWFSNPVTDMIEGSRDYDEQTIKRLHKVLRPFILRRLKAEVEKQLPKKYEHLVNCALSKRQRYLYDDFMSRASTKDQLNTGNVMSVLNVLMQLRKVCNHPNLFESRPISSPFITNQLTLNTPSLLNKMGKESVECTRVPFFLLLPQCRRDAFLRCQQLAPARRLIEEVTDENASTHQNPPVVRGFKFTPLKAPLPASMSRPTDVKKKNFQFVIPPTVAQQLDYNQPFLVQIQSPTGPKLLPIQLRPPPSEALAKIGIRVHASNTAGGPTANSPIQLPVWRLSMPSSPFTASQQPPSLTSPSSSSLTNRVAVVNYGGVGTRSGFAVTLLRSSTGQSPLGRDPSGGVIRTRTVLFRPAVPTMRPQITVQEVRAKTPPVVRYVDPSRGDLMPPSSSKPTTPSSPSASVSMSTSSSVSAVPPSPSAQASTTPVLSLSADSSVTTSDVSERTLELSPKITESTSDKMASTSDTAASTAGDGGGGGGGVKRPAPICAGLEPVAKRRSVEHRQQILQLLASENERRNLTAPLYGTELNELFAINTDKAPVEMARLDLDPLFSRFCIYTPPVMSGVPRSALSSSSLEANLESAWPKINSPFKRVIDSQMLQFPELRLIEYDCGKLQMLTKLLRTLKDEGHRCLIFTQMAKMLDILEAFLSYLGLKYLRLDGATRIELRQALMERFNQDPRVFCMILSTRSGGLGVNLTGADTVIFYDSDWNPTMDAQAQDRCHRIGQTRDVHIYRLISEKTVEENILKKAAQKRRLGEVAIEEAGFTTEFFKKGNLRELFDLSDDVAVDMAELSQQDLEQQMATVEDESDVHAARCARAETIAELSEFDETQATATSDDVDPDVLEVEQKMKQLMAELKPVERYAVKFLETLYEPERLDELQQTEEVMEQRKLQWESANRERLEQEEQQRKREEDEEFSLSYAYEDSLGQMFCPIEPSETMPVWTPPTPPLSDSEFDRYVESEVGYLYDVDPMEESDLPPIAGELDLFRTPTKAEQTTPIQTGTPISRPPSASATDIPAAVAETVANIRNSFNKTPKEGQPKSLFDMGGSPYRMKRDVRRPMTPPSPSVAEQESPEFPEWTVLEDYALLTAVTKGQQMAYSLSMSHAGHAPNWDYVSKWVSTVVGHYCSPRACCNRYQFVILPREEGRIVTIDPVTKKARKVPMGQQELGNMKKFRMRTGQQFQQDGSAVMAMKLSQRFAAVRQASTKRQNIGKERGLGLANYLPASINTRRKQELHLQSFGLSAERILTPGQLAEMREERLKELKKQHLLQQQQQQQQQQLALALQAQQQQQHQQQQQQQQGVHVSFQPIQQQPVPQYSQVTPQSQSTMEPAHPVPIRAAGQGASGYSVAAGVQLNQQHLQLSMQQSQQMDASQIAVSVHPTSRLVTGVQHMRQGTTVVSGSGGSPSVVHMMASASPRPHAGRASVSGSSGMTTATVYRQVGGLIRAQRTPPSTPAPSGLHAGPSMQVAAGSGLQRSTAVVSSSMPLAPISVSATSVESSGGSIIAPVVVQAPPPATVRFQAVSSAGARQKVQFGGGGFLVSADAGKPAVLSVPPLQTLGTSHGTTVTQTAAVGAMARGATMTQRHQVTLAQGGLTAAGKKNIALPRIATFTHGTNRGGGSPVHLVASPVTSRLATVQGIHSVRQAPSPSPSIRAQGAGAPGGRNIPSISMIMPLSRVETVASADSTAGSTGTTQTAQAATTSTPVLPSTQGVQAFGAPTTRGQ